MPHGRGEDADLEEEIHPSKKPRHDGDKILNVILDEHLAHKLGLEYVDLLSIPEVQYIWDVNPSSSYLYEIVSIIINVRKSEISLLRQADGLFRDPKADGWTCVTDREISLHGSYLCKVRSLGIVFLHPPF
jgi:hypothetical protein